MPRLSIDTGGTPLHYASEKGYLAIVQMLLSKGVSVAPVDDWGRIPLDCVRAGEHPIVADVLLKAMACYKVETQSPRRNSKEKTSLRLDVATESGLHDIVKQLLGEGPNIEARDKLGRTVLHYAAVNGQSGRGGHAAHRGSI